jgi:16S rRNA (uracil1498-N3)-methyltransferase
MSLPFFFTDTLPDKGELVLDQETSKHTVQVLRMQAGERLLLTDGRGNSAEAEIVSPHKRHCGVRILSFKHIERPTPFLTIAISLIKNASRFEWFLEKATELGTAEIIPLICERTEKQHYRYDRFLSVCKSAMLQSSQSWLPELHHPEDFNEVVANASQNQKFIAHCLDGNKTGLAASFNSSLQSHIVLVGPEGDFTEKEIQFARTHGFDPVSLGHTRLRTETAGIYAAVVCRP